MTDEPRIIKLPDRTDWSDHDNECLYVTTRMADAMTNDVAAGFAGRVARYYGTEVEE